MAVISQDVAAEVLEALGLSGKSVHSIKLEMKANSLIMVEVEYSPDRNQVGKLFQIIKRYELVERKPDGDQLVETSWLHESLRYR